MRLSYCPYRLLFKRPFGTAHGLRDGTDSVFVRVQEDGLTGYGEITLPPYVSESIQGALDQLTAFAELGLGAAEALVRIGKDTDLMRGHPGCRAGLHMALIDLIGKKQDTNARTLLGRTPSSARESVSLMTIGICPQVEVPERLLELGGSMGLKLKVGDAEARHRVQMIKSLDSRPLFIDGNQGLKSIEEVLELIDSVERARLLGIEQPFMPEDDCSNPALGFESGLVVYGDESLQDAQGLKARGRHFGGVNIKLMKCGGLDRALEMVELAERMGLRIMLGSMSESTLGCGAMAQLADCADLLDLDGPWLLRNDPFTGLTMEDGKLKASDGPGLGIEPRFKLDFESI